MSSGYVSWCLKTVKLRDALSPRKVEDFVHFAFAQPTSHLKLEQSFSHFVDLIFRCYRVINCEIDIQFRVYILCTEH